MKFLLVLAITAFAVAEPPVGPNYLPPSSEYGAPNEIQEYINPPSSQYGAPSSQYGAPSSQYNAPSSQYGAPSSQYNAPSSQYGAPSSQYGAPARNSNYRKAAPTSPASIQSIRFGSGRKSSRPSSRYGAPGAASARAQTAAIIRGASSFAPSTQYGAPAATYSAISSNYAAPSAQYGAPGSYSAHSGQFGSPSSAYGAPSGHGSSSSHFGSFSPSPQYGAPSAQYGAPSTGRYASTGSYEDDMSEPASYQFQYQVKDQEEGADFGHQEHREGEEAKGEYRVLLPDGRTQIVTYTADERGYIPEIRFEEPQGGYGRGPANSQKGY